jgi:hypothetical protein
MYIVHDIALLTFAFGAIFGSEGLRLDVNTTTRNESIFLYL